LVTPDALSGDVRETFYAKRFVPRRETDERLRDILAAITRSAATQRVCDAA